jgi:hypothetical protein
MSIVNLNAKLCELVSPILKEHFFEPIKIGNRIDEFINKGQNQSFIFSCRFYNSFDLNRKLSRFRNEPNIAVYNEEFNSICREIFEDSNSKEDSLYYVLTTKLSGIRANPDGERKVLGYESDLYYYPEQSMEEIKGHIISYFAEYAIPFCKKFATMEEVYNELCLPRNSVYTLLLPRKIIAKLIYSHLLEKMNSREIFDSSIDYFRKLDNPVFKEAFAKLYLRIWKVDIFNSIY